jgi:protein required for attachment to host cells
MLDRVIGWGEDSIEAIFNNLIIQKKIFGDAFAEIIRDDRGLVLNLKPLYAGDMRVVVDSKGMIKYYEQRTKNNKDGAIKFETHEILHLVNDRIANEIHGTSVIEAVQWVIDARNEAMADYRKVLHRNVVPVRIIEIDSDNTTKRDQLISQYQDAIAKGEVLVIPKGTVEIKDNTINIQDPITWIKYLENFFYQAVGIPKVILGGSEEFTEASSKIGYLTFEQVYSKEQRELEADLLNQLGVTIKFNKPVSLKNELLQSESKNTGQTGFQQSETTAGLTRNE